MKNKTCCFTGHRNIKKSEYSKIKMNLSNAIEQLINLGYTYFGTGGALGFDTLAAQVIISLKEKYNNIKLILVLPCRNQTKYWDIYDKNIYENIKTNADKIVFISNDYTKDCMLKRNRHLVDCSSVCICYLNKSYGGTAYTVKYAKSKGLKIINII